MSSLIVGSLFIYNLDRYLHSECGFKCGYLLENPKFFNPLDYLLRRLSSKHNYIINMELFLDVILYVVMVTYCLICIFYSIVKMGVHFFEFSESIYVKRRETLPQAMSIVSLLVIFMMFAFSYLLVLSIAPLYFTFGDQRLGPADSEKN